MLRRSTLGARGIDTVQAMAPRRLPDKPNKPEDRPMYVRLPADLHDAVKGRATEEDRTMAQTIRVALRYYLASTSPIAGATGSSS